MDNFTESPGFYGSNISFDFASFWGNSSPYEDSGFTYGDGGHTGRTYGITLPPYDDNNTTPYRYKVISDTVSDGHNETSFHRYSVHHTAATSAILGLMVLSTIIGNAFVIAAVILERNLHGVANYLVVSLAVADLMVASLVMPISAVTEVTSPWGVLGKTVCEMWISFDVLCCTASILHLVAISIDRYWAVTNIDYIRLGRSPRRIISMITLAWITALCISIPPQFGWREKTPLNVTNQTGEETLTDCIISQDLGYTIFSTFGAFYLPMLCMMVIYLRIFQVARRTIRKKNFTKNSNPGMLMKNYAVDETSPVYTAVAKTAHPANKVLVTQGSVSSIPFNPDDVPNTDNLTNGSPAHLNSQNGDFHQSDDKKSNNVKSKLVNRDRQREKLEAKRERKAARTLGIVTGCFIICWLPFFIVAIVAPFKHKDFVPPIVMSITLWLGYLNSTLNPVIYTIFSPDFRSAFRKILCGNYRGKNRNRFSP